MPLKPTTALELYASTGNKRVKGWFARLDAEIFRSILEGQIEKNLSGAMAEIGVHHGKSFVALCLGMRHGEKAYCIDVFQDQQFNLDKSGRGNRTAFERNLSTFEVDRNRVVIDPRPSQQVEPTDILNAVGPVRLFSVDGGHWLEVVQSDLRLAEACLADHGVIALDDFHRPEWPEVSAGYFAWHASRSVPIVPFAIGFNKLYLCREDWFDFYGSLLAEDPFISCFLKKHLVFMGVKIPVFQEFMFPEMPARRRAFAYLKVFYPDLFCRVARLEEEEPGWRQILQALLNRK